MRATVGRHWTAMRGVLTSGGGQFGRVPYFVTTTAPRCQPALSFTLGHFYVPTLPNAAPGTVTEAHWNGGGKRQGHRELILLV